MKLFELLSTPIKLIRGIPDRSLATPYRTIVAHENESRICHPITISQGDNDDSLNVIDNQLPTTISKRRLTQQFSPFESDRHDVEAYGKRTPKQHSGAREKPRIHQQSTTQGIGHREQIQLRNTFEYDSLKKTLGSDNVRTNTTGNGTERNRSRKYVDTPRPRLLNFRYDSGSMFTQSSRAAVSVADTAAKRRNQADNLISSSNQAVDNGQPERILMGPQYARANVTGKKFHQHKTGIRTPKT